MQKKFLVPDVIYEAVRFERERMNSSLTEEDIELFESLFFEHVRFYPEEVKNAPARLNLAIRIGLRHMRRLAAALTPSANSAAIEAGDERFRWMYVPDRIEEMASPTFICAGAGINISFELALAERYPNGRVILLDPSPQSRKHFSDFDFPENLAFLPVGLGDFDGTARFYKPSTKGIGSLSTVQLTPGEEFFALPITRVGTLCAEQGIDPASVALLKFDIEGAEHAVVNDLLETGFLPPQLAFEFDQPCPPWTTEDTIRRLVSRGYSVAAIWDANILLTMGSR